MEVIDSKHGHRQRLKSRFYKLPIRSLPDYEILEMVLFYVIPIKDTKKVAKQLLNTFGSLIGVLNADYKQLSQIKGLGNSVYLFFLNYLRIFLVGYICQMSVIKNSRFK